LLLFTLYVFSLKDAAEIPRIVVQFSWSIRRRYVPSVASEPHDVLVLDSILIEGEHHMISLPLVDHTRPVVDTILPFTQYMLTTLQCCWKVFNRNQAGPVRLDFLLACENANILDLFQRDGRCTRHVFCVWTMSELEVGGGAARKEGKGADRCCCVDALRCLLKVGLCDDIASRMKKYAQLTLLKFSRQFWIDK